MGSKTRLQTNNYTQVFTECCGRKGKLGLRRSGEALEEKTSELHLDGKSVFVRLVDSGLRYRTGSWLGYLLLDIW